MSEATADINPATAGYTCPSCGQWTQPGILHACSRWSSFPLWSVPPAPHCAGWKGACYYRPTIRETYPTKDGVAERWWCDEHAPKPASKRSKKGPTE